MLLPEVRYKITGWNSRWEYCCLWTLQAQTQPPFTDNCDAVFPHLTRNATYIARKDYHWPHKSVFIEYLFWKRLRHPISYRNSNLENNLVTLALHSFFFCFSVAQFSAFVFSQGEINPGFMTTKCGQDYSIWFWTLICTSPLSIPRWLHQVGRFLTTIRNCADDEQ